jgi:hypothetical protein
VVHSRAETRFLVARAAVNKEGPGEGRLHDLRDAIIDALRRPVPPATVLSYLAQALENLQGGIDDPLFAIDRTAGRPPQPRRTLAAARAAAEYLLLARAGVIHDPKPRKTVEKEFGVSRQMMDEWLKLDEVKGRTAAVIVERFRGLAAAAVDDREGPEPRRIGDAEVQDAPTSLRRLPDNEERARLIQLEAEELARQIVTESLTTNAREFRNRLKKTQANS